MYLIESQDWDESKRLQVNVFSDTMVKDEGSVVVRNIHLAKRSPQGGPAETVGTGTLVGSVKLVKFGWPALFKILGKTIGPPLFKKFYPPALKAVGGGYLKKGKKFPFLPAKTVKNSAIVPLGTILGAATIGAGAIGAGTLGKATLGAGALGAGALGAATLGAGAIGTAAVAGKAGVAGMCCMTKTYSDFMLCQSSKISV